MNTEPALGSKCGTRLFLYVAIGTLPAIVEWLTLTFDTSPRGILILLFKTLLTTAITWRAYIDTGGSHPPEQPPTDPKP